MKPKHVRKLLMSEIKSVADNPQTYCYNPHTDFTRKRKFTMERILSGTGSNGQKPYNLLHLNGLFDLNHCVYSDAIIQKSKQSNEHKAFTEMVDRSNIAKALVIADSGYESYNNLAHIQEKGWFYLIRIKDGIHGIKEGLDLPLEDTFDVDISLKLTRKQTKETKELFKVRNHYRFVPSNVVMDYLPQKNKKADPIKFYELSFRIVRFQITEDTYETVITSLERNDYPAKRLKELYASRWGIETSFRDLKYTIGMLDFHSKKVMCIQLCASNNVYLCRNDYLARSH